MAMSNCKECGKQVSTTATTCPNCGASEPTEKKEKNKKIRIWGLILGLILFFPLFFLDLYEAYKYLNFTLDFINPDIVSPIAEITDLLIRSDDLAMTAWRVAIPVYWILIWRFRAFIGCGVSMFLKKI